MANNKSKFQNIIKKESLTFEKEDFDIMDLALSYNPELRISAGILKAQRAFKIKYPIKTSKSLMQIMPKKSFRVEGHHFNEKFVIRYMREDNFPICDEQDLLDKCYIALMTCKNDIAWAANAPENAREILKEYYNLIKIKK